MPGNAEKACFDVAVRLALGQFTTAIRLPAIIFQAFAIHTVLLTVSQNKAPSMRKGRNSAGRGRIDDVGPRCRRGEWVMDRPGMRYRDLARRCREAAAAREVISDKTVLLRMAVGYDRRAVELEKDWELRLAAARL